MGSIQSAVGIEDAQGAFSDHGQGAPTGAGHRRTVEITVVHTTVASTIKAYRCAAKLAHGLSVRIRLLIPQTVPYPLPLEEPSAEPTSLVRRLATLLDEVEVDTTVDIRLCREPWEAIRMALPARSIVVLGGGSRWWPTREKNLARRLRKEGHQVVLSEGN